MLTKHKRHPCGFGQSLWPTNFFSNLLTVTLAFTISSLIFMPQGVYTRVSVQGVKSLGNHFACLCREFDFYE